MMPELIIVSSLEEAESVARRIIGMLEIKICDVVSYHSAHNTDLTVLEEASLKGTEPVILNGLVKIPLVPRRNICFDIKERPSVTFVSDRRIDIVRKLSERDTVTRIILINQDGLRLEKLDDD